MLQQQILDQLRKENENVIEGLAKQKALAMQATKVNKKIEYKSFKTFVYCRYVKKSWV